MARYIRFLWGMVFVGMVAIGPVGCRLDNDRSADIDIEKDNSGGRAGGGREDDRSGESNTEIGTAGINGGANIRTHVVAGTVRDRVTDEPLEGMKVVALSNVDLSELGVEATTGDDGRFVLEGIVDKEICVKVLGTEGEDARIDVCHCNIPSDQVDRDFISTELVVAEGISGLLYSCGKICTEPSVSGGVYYKNGAGEEIPVDCATVEIAEPADETGVFYFRDGLPNSDMTHTDITGMFLITRVPPGRIRIDVSVNGEKIGGVSTPICVPNDSTGGVFGRNIVRVYAEIPGNPCP